MPRQKEVISQVITQGKNRKKKTLTFQLSWLQKFKWLVYSHTAGGGLCKFCVLFPPSTGAISGSFVTKPFQNLRKACGVNGKLQIHASLQYHRDAAARAQALISSLQNPDNNIQHHISQQAREQYDNNVHILSTVVSAIVYYGRQNIALRGHRDDWTSFSSNKGKLISLLHLLSEFDDRLLRHLQYGRKNALYTSKTTQNELIFIIGEMIREKITANIREDNTFFSIIADEVTAHHSNQEVLSICLRFVAYLPSQKPSIKEVFFDFSFLTTTTGHAIATAIIDSLRSHSIDISKARGQAYDGASAMSSNRIGAQALIHQSAPLAVYTHGQNHVLNLSITASCQIPEIRNMIDTIKSVFLFYDQSPKRQKFLELVLDAKGAPTRKKHLTGLCKTRWVERHTCFETFAEMYEYTCISLEAIAFPHRHHELMLVRTDGPGNEQWNWQRDRETVCKAQGLFAMLQKPKFILAFVIVKNTLHLL